MKPKLFLCISIILAIIALLSFSYKEGFNNSNPNLIPNTGGPAWGQFVVNKSLIPSSVTYGVPIQVGTTSPITITPVDAGDYSANNTYRMGAVVTFNNLKYMCLAWSLDTRGNDYQGTYNASPTADTNAWAQVTVVANQNPVPTANPVPNPNLIANTGGPAWGQFVVNKSLIPSAVTYGVPIQVGTTSPITITPVDAGAYSSNTTYRMGAVVTFNNLKYMCLAWSLDTRGNDYQGTYNASPTADTNAWAEVSILMPSGAAANAGTSSVGAANYATSPTRTTNTTTTTTQTDLSRELEARLKAMIDERSRTLPSGEIKEAMMKIVREREGTLTTTEFDSILRELINARTLNPSSNLTDLVNQQIENRLGTPTTNSPFTYTNTPNALLSSQFTTLDNSSDQTGLPGVTNSTPPPTQTASTVKNTPISDPLNVILPGLDKIDITISNSYDHQQKYQTNKRGKNNYQYSFDPSKNPDTDC
jgi:hypothetical protein